MEHKVNRREFLKKSAFIFTGAMFVPATGILRPSMSDAKWWTMQGSGGGSSWALWDETSESTLSVNQETTNDTFVVLAENTAASGNEAGRGLVTGANLSFLQGGSVAGATGVPPRRTLAANDYFDFTDGLCTFVKQASKKWFACVKYAEVTTRGMYLDIYSVAAYIRVYNSGNKLIIQDASGNATSTDDTPAAGALYIYAWCDGTNTKAAFSTTKVSSTAALDANKTVTLAAAQNYSAVTFTSASIGIYSNDHTTGPVTGDWYYAVFSKAVLLA